MTERGAELQGVEHPEREQLLCTIGNLAFLHLP